MSGACTGPSAEHEAAAAALWGLWSADRQLVELPPSIRPGDLDAGWAVQRALDAFAGPRVGWKAAATSPHAQRVLGIDGPLAGALHRCQLVGHGAALPLPRMALAEAEFVFRTGRDLRPADAPFSREAVLAAVATVHPAIEVPDCRLSGYPDLSAPQLVADLMCGRFLAVAGEALDVEPTHLPEVDVVLERNGEETKRALGAEVMGDPCEALRWLANTLADRGNTLHEGDLVATGACVVVDHLEPGDEIRAVFGESAEIGVSFVVPERGQ